MSDIPDERLPTFVEACATCAMHWNLNSWSLLSAFASVGIEHGKSSWQMAEEYFAEFHRRKHREFGP